MDTEKHVVTTSATISDVSFIHVVFVQGSGVPALGTSDTLMVDRVDLESITSSVYRSATLFVQLLFGQAIDIQGECNWEIRTGVLEDLKHFVSFTGQGLSSLIHRSLRKYFY